MTTRRIVAGTDSEGKSRVFSDAAAPSRVELTNWPGYASELLWSTPGVLALERGAPPDNTAKAGYLPAPGETRLMKVTFPPDSVLMRADFDPAAFGAEFFGKFPGFAQTFEQDNPGMHTTDSIDYCIVLDGEIVLEHDDQKQVKLKPHDVVVQHGNRHAWRNPGSRPSTVLFVLMGVGRR